MKNKVVFIIIITLFFAACKKIKKNVSKENEVNIDKDDWIILFNGKNFEGWETYLGPKYDESKKDFVGDPIGLNKDPDNVFSVVQLESKSAIRISGQHFGGVSTKSEYKNYHLQLQFKWGEKKWIPRDNSKRDSGILYHANGDHGKGWFFWMSSEEFQIQEGDCGDYWGVGGALAEAPAINKSDDDYVYDPNGSMMIFGGTREKPDERTSARLIKVNDGEKQKGEWNTIDLYCYENKSVYFVNNVQTLKLYNLRKPGGIPLTKGKIQLQSEGAEIYIRNIRMKSISELPN